MGGRGKKSLIFGVLLFSVLLLALVGTQNALAVSIAVVEESLLELSGNFPIQLFFGAIKGETTMLYTDGEFDIPVDAGQASVTISTDKSTYKENEGIYVPYAISKRIPDEKLTITLYDPNDSDVSKTIITDHGLSSHLTSYTTFFPVDNKWKVGGVYTISGEYGSSKSIQTVKVNIFQSEESHSFDKDGDGIPDSKDKCPSHKERYNKYQDNDGCPDYPRIQPPFKKELLNGDEYIPITYSFDFTKRPLIGISFGENDFEQSQLVVSSVKKGVEMWTVPLEQKFGGDWSVDYVIITPQNRLEVKPDIIFNIETRESHKSCSEYTGWAASARDYDSPNTYKPKIPINVYQCYTPETVENPEVFSFLSQMAPASTNAHEFFHALGFRHTNNKVLDFMCGGSIEKGTCPQLEKGYTVGEYSARYMISDFDLTAIAYLYGVDGFQNPNRPVFGDPKFTADDYLNFDVNEKLPRFEDDKDTKTEIELL